MAKSVDVNYYQQRIHIYTERREKYKAYCIEKYGKGSTQYRERSLRYNNKILRWRSSIKKLKAEKERVKDFLTLVEEFSGGKLSGTYRLIYYRYGLENGFKGASLRRGIGEVDYKTPARCRKRLITLCNQSPEARDIWNRFKHFAT